MTRYVRVQGGEIVAYHRHIPIHHENMSHFNLASSHVHKQHGFYEVVESGPVNPGRFERIHTTETYVPEIDSVVRQHHLIALPPEVCEQMIAAEWQSVRIERNRKLAETDWTQLSDSPLPPAVRACFIAYRTMLRDMTDSVASPFDVVWPDLPATTL